MAYYVVVNMNEEEFVKDLEVCGVKIKLGIDDCGQQYFFEYIDENGETKEVSLGSYNFGYMDDIEYYVKRHILKIK